MADFDPVAIAQQAAVLPLSQRAVDATQQQINSRNDQVFGQTLQAASLAQRSQEIANQQSQFDIVQQLRQDQFQVQKQQSMAQIASINASTAFQQQQLKEAQTNADLIHNQIPTANQDVSMALANTAGSGTDLDSFASNVYSQLDPQTLRVIPPAQLDQMVQTAKTQYAGSMANQAIIQRNGQHQALISEGIPMGVDPGDYIRDGTPDNVKQKILAGNIPPSPNQYIDMTSYGQAVAQSKTAIAQAQTTFAAKTQEAAREAEINATYQGKANVANIISSERYDARIAGIKQADKKLQANVALNELNGLTKSIQGLPNPTPEQLKAVQDAKGRLDDIMQGAESSQTTTPSVPANSPYKVGGIYGNKTYLGGDPNNPANWKQ